MTVSDFFGFFLGIISLKGVSLFKVRGFIFKFAGWGMGGIGFDGEGFKKNNGMEGACTQATSPHTPTSLWETLYVES